jgi:nucleoid-associated protein YgaU
LFRDESFRDESFRDESRAGGVSRGASAAGPSASSEPPDEHLPTAPDPDAELQREDPPPAEPPASETRGPREQPVHDSPIASVPTHAYTVRAGDTLSEIAQRTLGSSRRWPDIVEANPGLDPSKLHVGKSIRIPGARAASTPATQTANAPAPARTAAGTVAAKTWKVGKGENLWRIAQRARGDGKRWQEIVAQNPGLDPDRLVLGQVLVLPGGAKAPKDAAPPVKNKKKAPKTSAPTTLVASSAGSERASRQGGKVK